MAAFVIGHSEPPRDGPQPFDPGRHLRQVAQLVGQVFADELDERGRMALREMDFAGRLSPFLGGFASLALFSDELYGQVWTEGGQVIGNVTLQQADETGLRWRITNVAVTPSRRGRGIARALMQATLREIAQRGGAWAILQVRANNAEAHGLYQRLGFSDICRDGVWRLTEPPVQIPQPGPTAPLEPLHPPAGGEWLALAKAARPQLAQWVDPLPIAQYQLSLEQRIGEWLGRVSGTHVVERWAHWSGQRLLGVVESRANPFGAADQMRFAVHPEARGRLEQPLLARGLRSLAQWGWRPVYLEHSGDHLEGVAALEASGFRIQRDLITMRRQITAEDKR